MRLEKLIGSLILDDTIFKPDTSHSLKLSALISKDDINSILYNIQQNKNNEYILNKLNDEKEIVISELNSDAISYSEIDTPSFSHFLICSLSSSPIICAFKEDIIIKKDNLYHIVRPKDYHNKMTTISNEEILELILKIFNSKVNALSFTSENVERIKDISDSIYQFSTQMKITSNSEYANMLKNIFEKFTSNKNLSSLLIDCISFYKETQKSIN